jgi:outer membrane biosynthesis protein TonB
MSVFRIPLAFALVAVMACASRPNPPPEPASAPVESPPLTPANAVTEAPASTPAPTSDSANATTAPSASAASDPNDPMAPAPAAAESEGTPSVTSGAIVVRGQLHPTRVQAGMRSAYPAIRACHRKALDDRTVEDKPVRVQLNFEITTDGRLTKLTDDTANLNPLFSSCVLRAVTAVTFQPPKSGTVSVTYPLELTKP